MSWTSDRYRLLRVIGVLLAFVGISLLTMRLWSLTSTPGDLSAITPTEQVMASIETPSAETGTDVAGAIPVHRVPVTEFMSVFAGTSSDNAPSEVFISADGDAAAFTTGPDDAPTGITTTTLVAGQAKEVADSAAAAGASVQVVPASQSREARTTVSTAVTNGVPRLLIVVAGSVLIIATVSLLLSLSRRRRRDRSDDDGPGGGDVPGTLYGDTDAVVSRRTARKSTTKVVKVPDTRFSDVAGCAEAVEDLAEIVEFLKDKEKFTAVGATPPAGAVLVGPPGTGKTLLARAVAGEAGVPFFAVAGPDFIEKYVGVGASRVRSLFAKARKSPNGAIVFIDEIDAVGRARGGHNSHPEQENTLNALLVEMDGFSGSNVIVLAATNRADMLDSALTRPGRLDREVQVPLPDRVGRESILAVHSRNRPLAEDVDLTLIARRTPGMSGAELARVVNEACIAAAREGSATVTNDHFDHAVATAQMGRARLSAVVTDHDRNITAWHEAGHTVAAMTAEHADRPVSVSIIPRGPAGGVTFMAQGDEVFLTRKQAHDRLLVALAGRAGEEILLDGEFTSGAHGDLTTASRLAFAMVTQYGMTDSGLMVRDENLLRAAGRGTDDAVDKVERMLAVALEEARALLARHRALVEAVAVALLDRDTLNAADLDRIRGEVESRTGTEG